MAVMGWFCSISKADQLPISIGDKLPTPTTKNHKSTFTMATLRFEDGAVQFRQRIAVSILSHRPILIRNIRNDSDEQIGLLPHEASFLRLIDQITNGSRIEINNTGTQVRLVPGVLVGGDIHHDCPVEPQETQRSVSWYLEGILPLAPFGKEPLQLHLTGITDGTCEVDPSCDYWKATLFPLLHNFGITNGGELGNTNERDILSPTAPHLRILRRGAAPQGGGLCDFYCPILRSSLSSIDWTDTSVPIHRVRGQAISTKLVSTSQTSRVAYAAKGFLHKLLPDVWIHTDAHTMKQHSCGPSPSVSLILTAQAKSGVVLCAQVSLRPQELPEDLGTRGAIALCEEVRRGGCVDSGGIQSLALVWMCLTPEDVSRIRLGTLTPYTIATLRLLKEAFGVEFKVQADHETKSVLLSCLGTGYRNMARAST